MPFYEYQCNACAHRLEVLQKISDEPLTTCPQCRAVELKKLISKSAFRLKGGGWYETDFKNSGTKEQHTDTGSDGKNSPAPDDKKAESPKSDSVKEASNKKSPSNQSTDKKAPAAKKSASSNQ